MGKICNSCFYQEHRYDGSPICQHIQSMRGLEVVAEYAMEDSELYREGGKQWFSAAPSKETLKHWFSLTDVLELQKLGYKIYEFQLVDTKQISDFEIVFTRDNIVEQREINYKEIWND